jgi:lysozyme family protein
VFCLHGRESSWDFTKHLHEGSPLSHRTRYVPKGRLPDKSPPYTFEQSAEDALYKLMDLENRVKWSSLPDALLAIELYNGAGYLKYHPSVPSPYLWSGTTVYSRGKYVSDGRWCKFTVDKQLGCAAILKAAGFK